MDQILILPTKEELSESHEHPIINFLAKNFEDQLKEKNLKQLFEELEYLIYKYKEQKELLKVRNGNYIEVSIHKDKIRSEMDDVIKLINNDLRNTSELGRSNAVTRLVGGLFEKRRIAKEQKQLSKEHHSKTSTQSAENIVEANNTIKKQSIVSKLFKRSNKSAAQVQLPRG